MSNFLRRHNTYTDKSDNSKDINRNLGILTNIQNFCKKYQLSFHPETGGGDPIEIIIEALETMIIRNEFKRVGPAGDSVTNPYIKIGICIKDKKTLYGYFTPTEIHDVSQLDSRIFLIED